MSMDATKIVGTSVSASVSTYSGYSQTTVATQQSGAETPSAVVELGGGAPESASAYGPTVEAMKKGAEARYENLRALVRELIARQQGSAGDGKPLEISPEVREQAQADIAPGGYYSPEATASRILDFAKALSGGDASKFKLLQDAVEKGFDDVAAMLSGELPEISQQTRELVRQGFDKWAEELGIAAAAGDEKEE
jgi:hypothetical protein